MTADEYLRSAIDHIDAQLGKGYAKAHPELIAAGPERQDMPEDYLPERVK